MDEGSTLIDNSKAGELVENNSQWHPGFSTLGSVPGSLSIGTLPPTPQAIAQATAATLAETDLLDSDEEAEMEDEVDEDMDEIDDVDDAFDEDALDDEEEAQLAAFALESSINEPNPQAHTADPFSYLTEVEQILSNDDFISAAAYSETPGLEEVSSASQTDQQRLQGNASPHRRSDQPAN